MHCQTNTTLEVLAHYLVRNVSIKYARWWHKVVGGIVVHLSALPPPLGRNQRKGDSLGDLQTYRFSGNPPHPKKGEGGEGM